MQVATAVRGACVPPSHHQASVASPGLVSSITSVPDTLISFAPSVAAEKRIARLKKAVWASGHLHGIAERGRRPAVCWFVTLTYVGVKDWKPQHIAKACRLFRKWCKARRVPCRYTWVAELQARGAVHYHLLAWLPPGVHMPHWDADQGTKTWWPHGMTNTQPARAGVGYLMKYLSKLGQFHRFPKGLRLYGVGGLCEHGRKVRAWLNLPEWVKLSHGVGDVSRRVGKLVHLVTGELLASPWSTQLVPGGIVVKLRHELPPRFHDGAYSAWPAAT